MSVGHSYGLNADCNMCLSKDFEDAEWAQLKPHYCYKEPTREAQRLDYLQITITDYYKANELKLRKSLKIWEKYCEFCGDGDIYIGKCNTGTPLVVFSGEELNDEEQGVPSTRNDDDVGLTIKAALYLDYILDYFMDNIIIELWFM